MNYKLHALPNVPGSATQSYPWQPDKYIQLDTLDGDPIKITMMVEDTTKATSVASSFTREFRLPKTFNNDRVFWGSCDVNNITYNPRLPVRAYIEIDGYVFSEGQITLQGVSSNYKTGTCFYEVIFSSEVGSFIESLGEKVLGDLDTSSLTYSLSLNTITQSWAATSPFSFSTISKTAGIRGGNVIFPLIEWGYEYKSDNTIDTNRNTTISEHSCNASFFKNNLALFQQQIKPIVRTDWIMNNIFSQSGYSFTSSVLPGTTSTFFDSADWLCLYTIQDNTNRARIDAPLSSWSNMKDTSGKGAMTLATTTTNVYYLWNLPSTELTGYWDGSYYAPSGLLDPENGRYKIPFSGTYSFRFSTGGPEARLYYFNNTGAVGLTMSFTYSVRLFNYSTNTIAHTFSDIGMVKRVNLVPGVSAPLGYYVSGQFGTTTSATYSAFFSKDDLLKMEISMRYNVRFDDFSGLWGITSPEFLFGDFYMIVNPTASIINIGVPPFSLKMKQRDYISSISKKFRFIFEPTSDPKTIRINPWVYWIKSGNAFDWSNKLDTNFDFRIEPIFNDRGNTIYISDNVDEDWPTKYYQERQKKIYGEFRYDSFIKSLQGTEEYITEFAPTQLVSLGYCGTDVIPQNSIRRFAIISVSRDAEPFNKDARREPIEPRPRLCYWNGTASVVSLPPFPGQHYHIRNDAGSAQQFTYRPLVSNMLYWPDIGVQPGNNFDINFNNFEYQQYIGELFSRPSNDCISVYHNDWLNLYYDRPFQGFNNRKAKCRLILYDNDVRNFKFNNRFFINNSWWFITQIKDYQIGIGGSTEVELIQYGYINAAV